MRKQNEIPQATGAAADQTHASAAPATAAPPLPVSLVKITPAKFLWEETDFSAWHVMRKLIKTLTLLKPRATAACFLLIRRLTFSPGFKLAPDIFTITVSLLANRGSEKGREENMNSAFNFFFFCPLSLPFADRDCGAIRIQWVSAQAQAQTCVRAFLRSLKGSRWRWDFPSGDWHTWNQIQLKADEMWHLCKYKKKSFSKPSSRFTVFSLMGTVCQY